MGIFDFFKGNKKEDKFFEQKINSKNKEESEIIKKLFPSLKGIHFESISTKLKGDSPEKFFSSDVDGKWYYTVINFAMIFKAFSHNNFEKELNNLLEKNSIKKNDYFEEGGIKMWNGNGFKIEAPPKSSMNNLNMIMITNEEVVPIGLEIDKLKTTNLSSKVDLPDGYDSILNGIENLYDGDKFLKSNNGSLGSNIPLLFQDPNDKLHYILIGVPSLTIGKKIIDDIIEKNYGKSNFEKLKEDDDWSYIYKNKFFTIGFMNPYSFVRINMLHVLQKI